MPSIGRGTSETEQGVRIEPRSSGSSLGLWSVTQPGSSDSLPPRTALGSWDRLMHSGQEICVGNAWDLFPDPSPALRIIQWISFPGFPCSDTAWICCPPGHSAELICALRLLWREGPMFYSHFLRAICIALVLPKICMSSCRFSDLRMWLHLQQIERNDRLTHFIMFILTFCPEMVIVLHEENCWAVSQNVFKLLNLKYVRCPLIQPRGVRRKFAKRPNSGFVSSALRNILQRNILRLFLFHATYLMCTLYSCCYALIIEV